MEAQQHFLSRRVVFTRKLILAGLLSTAFAAFGSSAAAGRISSLYTQFTLKDCQLIETYENGQGAAFRCPGFRGHKITVVESDLRFFITYRQDGKKQTVSHQTLPAFNSIFSGNRPAVIEWRVHSYRSGWVPFATIIRYYSNHESGNGKRQDQTLVITKITRDDACHIGYVDAKLNPDANIIARQVADRMSDEFDCRRDTPQYFGKTRAGN